MLMLLLATKRGKSFNHFGRWCPMTVDGRWVLLPVGKGKANCVF